MSLFSSLQLAGNALQAAQIGLNVVGNNIANANTPGFVRERAVFAPAPVIEQGSLTFGLGVEVAGIVQVIDSFTESRLRDASGERASAEAQEAAFRNLEVILNPLGDDNIATQLTNFFNSFDLLSPESTANRNLVISAGEELAQAISTAERRINVEREGLNTRVSQLAGEINTLTEEIRQLNLRIVTIEGGGASGSDAGGLRSQRGVALSRLAEIADIQSNETETGVVNVTLGGEFLVFEATRREVASETVSDGDALTNRLVFTSNNAEVNVGGGELGGIEIARDTIIDDFLTGLDDFAGALAFEFNRVYSQGQGEVGFTSLTSANQVDDPNTALNEAGLNFTPQNGEFTLLLRNRNIEDPTADTERTTIDVDLLGTNGSPTTLQSLADALDAVDGISASVSLDNQLVINSDSPADLEFGFADDTSGVLAALGLNTFFTGSDAGSLAVNGELTANDASNARLATSLTGFGLANDNAIELAQLRDQTLSTQENRSISGIFSQLIDNTTQGATTTASIADGLRVFEGTLEASAAAVSGVNLDEEAVDLIQLQRAYQASARYISTLSELLDILVNL